MRFVEHSEGIRHAHKDKAKSGEAYDKYGSAWSEVFLRPIELARPAIYHFSVLEDAETCGYPKERIKYFDKKHMKSKKQI